MDPQLQGKKEKKGCGSAAHVRIRGKGWLRSYLPQEAREVPGQNNAAPLAGCYLPGSRWVYCSEPTARIECECFSLVALKEGCG